jgi:hypothetical protein
MPGSGHLPGTCEGLARQGCLTTGRKAAASALPGICRRIRKARPHPRRAIQAEKRDLQLTGDSRRAGLLSGTVLSDDDLAAEPATRSRFP